MFRLITPIAAFTEYPAPRSQLKTSPLVRSGAFEGVPQHFQTFPINGPAQHTSVSHRLDVLPLPLITNDHTSESENRFIHESDSSQQSRVSRRTLTTYLFSRPSSPVQCLDVFSDVVPVCITSASLYSTAFYSTAFPLCLLVQHLTPSFPKLPLIRGSQVFMCRLPLHIHGLL